jgi:hypothetical protein
MTITIEVAEEQVAALKAKALAEGLSLEDWLQKIVGQEAERPRKLLKSARGTLAKYGPGPSAEEIDENRREMLRWSPRKT